MEAQAARVRPVERRWRHALESRRVLAPLLIAPAVVFMLLVVGVPFAWAIYLSFTDAVVSMFVPTGARLPNGSTITWPKAAAPETSVLVSRCQYENRMSE